MRFIMKKASPGLKPQDVIILLKIISLGSRRWRLTDLAHELEISQSEISQGLERLLISKLISSDKRTPLMNSFFEFLVYGLKYVFPAVVGPITRGVLTAHSFGILKKKIISSNREIYVWPDAKGDKSGHSINPLYGSVPKAVKKDRDLHELLSLVDSLRIGRAREIKLAIEELKKRMKI